MVLRPARVFDGGAGTVRLRERTGSIILAARRVLCEPMETGRGHESASFGLDLSKTRSSVKNPPNRVQTDCRNSVRCPSHIRPSGSGCAAHQELETALRDVFLAHYRLD